MLSRRSISRAVSQPFRAAVSKSCLCRTVPKAPLRALPQTRQFNSVRFGSTTPRSLATQAFSKPFRTVHTARTYPPHSNSVAPKLSHKPATFGRRRFNSSAIQGLGLNEEQIAVWFRMELASSFSRTIKSFLICNLTLFLTKPAQGIGWKIRSGKNQANRRQSRRKWISKWVMASIGRIGIRNILSFYSAE